MKHIVLSLCLISTFSVRADVLPTLNNISSLEWKNRIVVIKMESNKLEALHKLNAEAAEIDDRDIIWFLIGPKGIQTNYLGNLSTEFTTATQNRFDSVGANVILVGKDGGIKLQADTLNLVEIFAEIDTMPMRQYEMKH